MWLCSNRFWLSPLYRAKPWLLRLLVASGSQQAIGCPDRPTERTNIFHAVDTRTSSQPRRHEDVRDTLPQTTAPHLGAERSAERLHEDLPCVGTAGLWGHVPAHSSSSVWLLLLPFRRNELPSLCPLGLSPCRHDARSSKRPMPLQGTTPTSSCPLLLIPQNVAKWDSKMGEAMLP